jgi:hypothetical protein
MTSSLARRVLIRCPERFATHALRETAGAFETHEGHPWTFAVKAPVRLTSLDADIVLCRETIAELTVPRDGVVAPLDVHWQPAAGASFPLFDGRLWCEAETLCTSWLRLEGRYETSDERLRLAERGERTIGHRIALATAKVFLDEVAESLQKLRTA